MTRLSGPETNTNGSTRKFLKSVRSFGSRMKVEGIWRLSSRMRKVVASETEKGERERKRHPLPNAVHRKSHRGGVKNKIKMRETEGIMLNTSALGDVFIGV